MRPEGDSRKPLQSFAAQAAFVTLLLCFVPSVNTTYQILFNGVANAVVAPFAGERWIEFDWIHIGARTDHGEIIMRGMEAPDAPVQRWQTAFSVTHFSYWPGALFVGLMVATPLPIARQALALVGGLLLQQLFLIAQLGARGLAHFQTVRPEEFGTWLLPLEPLLEAFLRSLLPRYVIALALWAVLARPDRGIDWTPLGDRVAKLGR